MKSLTVSELRKSIKRYMREIDASVKRNRDNPKVIKDILESVSNKFLEIEEKWKVANDRDF